MELPKRKHPRLSEYDYSLEGAYFLTICTKDRIPLLSNISKKQEHGVLSVSVGLTQIGYIAQCYLLSIQEAYPNVSIDAYVIMPDHIHILLQISRRAESSRPTIAQIVAAFKRFTNRDCQQKLWQDSYYDHVIRNEEDYQQRVQYIETNPLRYLLKQE